jgi:hypothetical protein
VYINLKKNQPAPCDRIGKVTRPSRGKAQLASETWPG